jgi:uncharacterized small protein (DUF1192 family)
MNEDDETGPKKTYLLEKPVLDPLSVADLRDYIDQLTQEIARVEGAIAKKARRAWPRRQFFQILRRRVMRRSGACAPDP